MASLFSIAVILILMHFVVANDELYTIQTTQIDAVIPNLDSAQPATFAYAQNAAGGRFIMTRSYSGTKITVYERDTSGSYANSYQFAWSYLPVSMSTNGEWFGTVGGSQVNLFQIDSGAYFNMTTLTVSPASWIQILNDNSVVLLSNSTVDTYDIVNGSWIRVQSQSVNFIVTNPFSGRPKQGSDQDSVPHLTDTTLAAFNPVTNNIELYTRNTDKSWLLFDTVPIDVSKYRANRIIWPGDDAVFAAHTTWTDPLIAAYGKLYVYRRLYTDHYYWIQNQGFEVSQVTANPPGFLGYHMIQLTNDSVIVSAPSGIGGEILFFRKVSGGSWQPINRIIGSSTRQYFGYYMLKNDYDIIVQSSSFISPGGYSPMVHYQVSPCFLPLKYECFNVTVDTCQTSVPYDQLYYVGDSCTSVQLINWQLEENVNTFSFSFTRSTDSIGPFYCNSSITCPKTQTTTPTDPPMKEPTSSPSTVPQVIVPVTSPSDEGKVTNDSNKYYAGISSAIVCILGLFVLI